MTVPTAMLDAAARLDALAGYAILDTPPEPEFDDIVQIAQKTCETSVALISLVARDRQWFKARIGFAACETPIGQSVCAHALAVDDLLVIPDLAADPRTKDNALVTGEPRIRFYAGAVLKTPEGVPIGSLCVIDKAPRPAGLSPEQAETLLALARQTMVVMALRRAVLDRDAALAVERKLSQAIRGRAEISEAVRVRLHADKTRQVDAQEAGGIGVFEVDVATYRCRVSAEFCRIFGLPVATEYGTAEIQTLVQESDRYLLTTPRTLAEGSARREVEFRVRRASDGALRWIGRSADFRTDKTGAIISMVGVVRDITDRKRADLRAATLIGLGDTLRDATTTAEAVDLAARALGTTLEASRAALSLLDLAAETFKIERDWTAPGIPSLVGQHALGGYRVTVKRLANGVPVVNANIPADGWLGADVAAYEAIDVKAQIVVPLIERGRLVAGLFVHSITPRTWSAAEIDFAVAVADRTYATLAKIRAEDHQNVLNQELSHRLKNTLAMVQAIANQTLRGIAERDVVRALEARIIALGKAHDVLLQKNWASARMADVVEKALGLHGHEDQVRATGPDLLLGPKATLSLSLLLHELLTNAVKYGALSVEDGSLSIGWRIADEAEPMMFLTWAESNGPVVVSPQRKGFGSRLINMGLAGAGKVKLEYLPEGLRAEFRATLRTLEQH